ncbi:BQ2448_6186 [Microbotryum intermedium]|uniref:BQ2448_6186 protein n=1 Tax=Microbotryum intermedium TaxID=269621 RepID=A0A238FRM4_9BASI|nr:BQ2448_6186 [Microbotryum intermedium]
MSSPLKRRRSHRVSSSTPSAPASASGPASSSPSSANAPLAISPSSPPTSLASHRYDSPDVEQSKRPTLRPRSKSMHYTMYPPSPPSFPSLDYGSTLLTSLDLSGSIWALREYVLGRVDQVEHNIQLLKAYVEESESEDYRSGDSSCVEPETETETENEHDNEGLENYDEIERLAEMSESERDLIVNAVRSRRRRVAVDPALATQGQPTLEQVKQEISALELFITKASRFLTAIRSEWPLLSTLNRPTYVNGIAPPAIMRFQLSLEARQALDHFLEDHPIPSLPRLNFRARFDNGRQRASDSASALLSRVSGELAALQHVLNSTPTSERVSSFMPSLPTLPSTPAVVLTEMRDYFAAESTRLGGALQKYRPGTATFDKVSSNLRTFRNEASDSLQAGVAHLQDGANELTALLSSSSSAALDEAAKFYHAALSRGKERLLRYEELPFPWRNNEHIITGYRFYPIERWGVLLRSAFEIHNETINIQSHFVGFLSLVYLLVYVMPGSPHWLPNSHWADTAIALVFVGAAMKCLLCSTAWHLMAGCATDHWHRGAACVDYVGISGLIAASVMGIEYYGFYCRPQLATFYIIFSGALGVMGMVFPWQAWFNEREYKSARIAFFLSLGGSAIMPVLHMVILYGLLNVIKYLLPVGLSVSAYLVGLSFYGYQFPECTAPGRWDIFFASHQVWHVAIVFAVWAHWWALSGWAKLASQGMDLSCSATNLIAA